MEKQMSMSSCVREGVGDKLSTVFYNSKNSDGKFSIKERRGMGRTWGGSKSFIASPRP
jgi:hypothetical protein